MGPSKKKGQGYYFYSSGLTLIEILLILMLFSIIASIVVFILSSMQGAVKETGLLKKQPQDVKRKYGFNHKPAVYQATAKEREDMLKILNGMKFYRIDNGFYPSNEQGISALVFQPTTQPAPQYWREYLKLMPTDRWGRPYRYANPSRYNDITVFTCKANKMAVGIGTCHYE